MTVRTIPVAWLLTLAVVTTAADAQQLAMADTLEHVTVTATRRNEELMKVASSVGVLTQDDMANLGVKDMSEAVRFLPGVTFDSSSNGISIRGISSAAGAGTTGIYIDDMPIQMRSLDYNSNNTLPAVFDLERLEVLRGPQGTLFGAGSEGGAVRYITKQPNTDAFEGLARAEGSVGRNGMWNYEAGLALSGPVVDGLAMRVSGWTRHEGGTVDKFDALSGATTIRNANSSDTYVLHAVATWSPLAHLTITPSDYYQSRIKHDTDSYWVSTSDRNSGHYRNGTPERLSDTDHFNLTALKIQYAFGGADLISDSSYFTRQQHVRGYSGTLYDLSYFQQLTDAGTDPQGNPCTAGACASGLYPLLTENGINLPGFGPYQVAATVTNAQHNFVQELRLQSNDPQARFTWLVGLFYSLNTQHSIDAEVDPQLPEITNYLWGVSVIDAWGAELPANNTEFLNDTVAHDRQIAGFANASYTVTDELKLQAGLRYGQTHFDFRNYSDGPQNFGFTSGTGDEVETPLTTMVNVSWTPNDKHMIYATYSSGYRIGGANQPFPEASCQADLDILGLTGVPRSFRSDRVTSYELGTKSQMLDGHLQLQSSVYRLNWSRMQQTNYLSSCGFQYVANFGSAASTGFDLQADWIVTEGLGLHFTLGYMDAYFTQNSKGGTNSILAHKGDALPGSPWTYSITADYSFNIASLPITAQADYEYASHNPRMTPQIDPATTQYDPGVASDPATGVAAFRLQTAIRQLSVSLFVENAFDAQPQLGINHQDKYTLLYEAWTLRPRTVGLTLSRRF